MRAIIILIILILAGAGYWYFIQPAFRTVEVDDALPVDLDSLEPAPVARPAEPESVSTPPAPQPPTEEVVAPLPEMEVSDEPNVQEMTAPKQPAREAAAPKQPVREVAAPKQPVREVAAPQPTITEQVALTGTPFHPVDGFARIVTTADGKQFLRYEDLDTIDGPRLHVYLMADLDGNDIIDLGPRKGTSGNINYEIPAGVDLEKYKYAAHWCVPFSVLFNYADISQ